MSVMVIIMGYSSRRGQLCVQLFLHEVGVTGRLSDRNAWWSGQGDLGGWDCQLGRGSRAVTMHSRSNQWSRWPSSLVVSEISPSGFADMDNSNERTMPIRLYYRCAGYGLLAHESG